MKVEVNKNPVTDLVLISGELSIVTVNEVREKLRQLFDNEQCVTLDFSGVTRCDSAGVALLLDWIRTSKQKNIQLSFKNFIPQMSKIISICGLSQFIREGCV